MRKRCVMSLAATLSDVQSVYSGPEGELWELIMGEQIHIGGLQSSLALAEAAGIEAGSRGLDLCCCTGAGMRFLVRFRNVDHMVGVDATELMVRSGQERCAEEGLETKIEFVLADATRSGLPDACVDFVWGEDAWCYVENKRQLIAEAVRMVRAKGTIAFTDWLEGDGISATERERFLSFMKFPGMQTLAGYRHLLEEHGCSVEMAEDTGRFAPCIDMYLQMVSTQLTYDALKIVGFDEEVLSSIAGEMAFAQELAKAGKILQGMVVARKP
jgi:ubiquinone/menaquinone biosynthesis C-methylase UbiE